MSQSVRDERPYIVWPIFIPSGASICPTGISMAGYKYVSFLVPSGANFSVMSFRASTDGINYFNLQMDAAEVQQSANAGVWTVANQNAMAFAAVNYFTIRAGTSSVPIIQSGSGSVIQVSMAY